MARDLEGFAQALLVAARRAGAEAADALAVAGDSLSIEVREGALEEADRAEGVEIGLRVLIGCRQACVSSSDTRPETMAAMAERAVAMAREAPEDPYCGLAAPDQLARDFDAHGLDLVDPEPAPDPAELQERALAAEAAALGVAGVSRMDGAGASWQATAIHLAASNGFSAGYGRTSHGVQAVAICGEGLAMERDYAFETRTHRADLPDPEVVGALAGARAVARAGARKPPTGAWPVLFDERISGSLIGHLTQAINGAMIARGSSWLKDALGTAVLPAGVDLVEDPARPRVSGSRPFDAEGLPALRRALVSDGVLTGWTLDLASGRQLGMASTGNASRGPGGPPSPSVGNLTLSPGTRSRDALLAHMGEGLLVTSLMGSSINPTTGDYSRGASGFWVRGGAISHPVNECTIAGNLREMLLSLVPANDGQAHKSRVIPSLLVDGLVIAGS